MSSQDIHVVYGAGSIMAHTCASRPNITANPVEMCEVRNTLATHLGYFLQYGILNMTEALELLYIPASLGMASAIVWERGTLYDMYTYG